MTTKIPAALAAPAAMTLPPPARANADPAAAMEPASSAVIEADVPALVRQLAQTLLRAPHSAGSQMYGAVGSAADKAAAASAWQLFVRAYEILLDMDPEPYAEVAEDSRAASNDQALAQAAARLQADNRGGNAQRLLQLAAALRGGGSGGEDRGGDSGAVADGGCGLPHAEALLSLLLRLQGGVQATPDAVARYRLAASAATEAALGPADSADGSSSVAAALVRASAAEPDVFLLATAPPAVPLAATATATHRIERPAAAENTNSAAPPAATWMVDSGSGLTQASGSVAACSAGFSWGADAVAAADPFAAADAADRIFRPSAAPAEVLGLSRSPSGTLRSADARDGTESSRAAAAAAGDLAQRLASASARPSWPPCGGTTRCTQHTVDAAGRQVTGSGIGSNGNQTNATAAVAFGGLGAAAAAKPGTGTSWGNAVSMSGGAAVDAGQQEAAEAVETAPAAPATPQRRTERRRQPPADSSDSAAARPTASKGSTQQPLQLKKQHLVGSKAAAAAAVQTVAVDEARLAREALQALQGRHAALALLEGRADGRQPSDASGFRLPALPAPRAAMAAQLAAAGRLRASLDAAAAAAATIGGATGSDPILQGFGAALQQVLARHDAALQALPAAAAAARAALAADTMPGTVPPGTNSLTLIEVVVHSAAVRRELQTLGGLCCGGSDISAVGGSQLLDRLWRRLEAAEAADAPLVRWLLLGAFRPWLAAARAWCFTAAPSAQPVHAPPFLQHIAHQLQQAGRQLRLLAGLPERLAGDLVPRLAASAAAEAAAAGAAAAADPWATAPPALGGALVRWAANGEAPYPTPFTPAALERVRRVHSAAAAEREAAVSQQLAGLAAARSADSVAAADARALRRSASLAVRCAAEEGAAAAAAAQLQHRRSRLRSQAGAAAAARATAVTRRLADQRQEDAAVLASARAESSAAAAALADAAARVSADLRAAVQTSANPAQQQEQAEAVGLPELLRQATSAVDAHVDALETSLAAAGGMFAPPDLLAEQLLGESSTAVTPSADTAATATAAVPAGGDEADQASAEPPAADSSTSQPRDARQGPADAVPLAAVSCAARRLRSAADNSLVPAAASGCASAAALHAAAADTSHGRHASRAGAGSGSSGGSDAEVASAAQPIDAATASAAAAAASAAGPADHAGHAAAAAATALWHQLSGGDVASDRMQEAAEAWPEAHLASAAAVVQAVAAAPIAAQHACVSRACLRILFDELRLCEHLELLRRVFLGGAGDFADALAARLAESVAGDGGITTAAVDAALEDAIQASSLAGETLLARVTGDVAAVASTVASATQPAAEAAGALDVVLLRWQLAWPLTEIITEEVIAACNAALRVLLRPLRVSVMASRLWLALPRAMPADAGATAAARLAKLHVSRAQAAAAAAAAQAAVAERLHGQLWQGFQRQLQAAADVSQLAAAVHDFAAAAAAAAPLPPAAEAALAAALVLFSRLERLRAAAAEQVRREGRASSKDAAVYAEAIASGNGWAAIDAAAAALATAMSSL